MSTKRSAPAVPQALIARLTEVVGEDGIVIDPDTESYRDPYWIPGDESYRSAVVVLPTTTAQIQRIVKLANEFSTPLWPYSQGRNYGYGGPSPRVAGSIQVGLTRMNRVLEIDEELAYAVVEPGVTWFDLHAALEKNAPSLAVSVPDLGWGSVIGNSMDSGVTYMKYGADFAAPAGLEVVLPDGELLRTGHGALPGGRAWHAYKRSLGPSLDALFVQSNFGIVTRMGVWLTRKPEIYAPLALTIDDDADLELAIDVTRELRLAGDLEGVPGFFPTMRATVMMSDVAAQSPRHQLTADEVVAVGRETGVGAWTGRAAVWGHEAVVDAKLAKIEAAWNSIPSGRLTVTGRYRPHEYDRMKLSFEQILAGVPTLKAIEMTAEHVGHVGFSPVVPLRGEDVRRVLSVMRDRIRRAGLNYTGMIAVTGERSCITVCGLQYDRTDAASVANAFQLAKELISEVGALGYGEYRAHLDFMDLAADQYSWNDHAYRRFVSQIKDALDPQGILAPGRHGIWPRAYRDFSPQEYVGQETAKAN